MKVKFEIELMAHEGKELFEMLCRFNGVALQSETPTPIAPITTGIPLNITQVPPMYTPEPMVAPAPIAYPAPDPAPIAYPAPDPAMIPPQNLYVTPAPAPIPSVDPNSGLTLEKLAVAASTELVDKGRREELLGILAVFNCQTMTQLPTEQYGAFAQHLRSKGVKI